MCWHDSLPCVSPASITYIFLCKIFTQEHILAEQGAVKGINICSILMKKHRLPLRSGKPDMAADQANQMGIQITQGGGVDQVQGIHDLPQTTRTFLIESRHHLHQAKETGVSLIFYQVHQISCVVFACQIFFLPGISRYEIQALHSLMILGSTVTVPRRQWITPLSRLERDCKRLHPTLPEEDKEKGARGKSCQNSAMSAVQNTLWKMPSSAVNVE